MKKLYSFLLTSVFVLNIYSQNENEFGTLRIMMPAKNSMAFNMGAYFKYYISIDENYVGNIKIAEYSEIKIKEGIYNIRITGNFNGMGVVLNDTTYDYVLSHGYSIQYKNITIKNGETCYIDLSNNMTRKPIDEKFFLKYLSKSQINETPKLFSYNTDDYLSPENSTINLRANYKMDEGAIKEKHIEIDNRIPTTTVVLDNCYVLIVSNEIYDYLDNVTFANHDGEIFKEYCIKTLGIPEKQIFYYENATFGKIADGVGKIKYCLNNFENSKAIVYYCGHGIPDEKTGDAYIVPVDGKGTNMTTCYPLQTLYKTLAATKAESITYFMDACFTGANKEGSMLVAARGVAREPKKEILTGKSIVFSASSGDETAMTLEEQRHGLFTYYLLKKLQETEGNVSYGELSDYIKKNVQKDAFLINEKPQTPVVATSPAVVNTWKSMKLK